MKREFKEYSSFWFYGRKTLKSLWVCRGKVWPFAPTALTSSVHLNNKCTYYWLLAKTLKSQCLWIQCIWLWGSDQFKRKYCIAAGTFALKWKWTCMIRDTKIKSKVLQEIPRGKPQIDLLEHTHTQKKNFRKNTLNMSQILCTSFTSTILFTNIWCK